MAGLVRLVAVILVSACSTACVTFRDQHVRLLVTVAPDANGDQPVPVDVVMVWNKKTAGQVGELAAKDWFQRKRQMRRDDPDERAFAVREWEWVPGQDVPALDVVVPSRHFRAASAVFLFANYPGDGPHRVRMTPGKTGALELQRDDLQFQEQNAR